MTPPNSPTPPEPRADSGEVSAPGFAPDLQDLPPDQPASTLTAEEEIEREVPMSSSWSENGRPTDPEWAEGTPGPSDAPEVDPQTAGEPIDEGEAQRNRE